LMLVLAVMLVGMAEGIKIKMTEKFPTIATFHPEPSYAGTAYPVAALYENCYNFHGQVESLKLAGTTEVCELFYGHDCTDVDAPQAAGGRADESFVERLGRKIGISKKIEKPSTRKERGVIKVYKDTEKLKFTDGRGRGEVKVRSLRCWRWKKVDV